MTEPRKNDRGVSWRWIVAILAILVVGRVGWNAMRSGNPEMRPAPLPPEASGAHGAMLVHWVPIAEAANHASATRKPILYDFNAAWCPPCRALAADVFADAARAREVENHAVPVTVVDRYREDGSNAPEVDDLQRRFDIQVFPTLVLFSPETGKFQKLEGYAGPDGTLDWLSKSVAVVAGG